MQIRRVFVLCGVTAASVLACTTAALAAGTKVSVRVEGKSRTLLPATTAKTHRGSITKGGTPAGLCSATSAAGALDVATHHNWGATFSSSLNEPELISVLGEKWPFTQANYYWAIWVNDKYAQVGMCELKLRRGDRVLFAVDSDKHHEHQLSLAAPRHATAGRPFTVTVDWLADNGKAKPLSGVRIMGASTNQRGRATITPTKRGKLRLKASKPGYIRSAVEPVSVSG
jgi:hypothetical protein